MYKCSLFKTGFLSPALRFDGALQSRIHNYPALQKAAPDKERVLEAAPINQIDLHFLIIVPYADAH
jgi:hypothetical protein